MEQGRWKRAASGMVIVLAAALALAAAPARAQGNKDTGAAPPAAAAAVAAPAPAPAGVAPVGAPTGGAAPEVTELDNRIQDVKSDVIQLNRDLMVLEEELLFPANTQLAIFLSMDVGKLFSLDSVRVTLDEKEIAAYLYTPAEVQALHRGGVQRLYLGNLRTGAHEIVAVFTGKGPHDRDYKRATTLKFDKSNDAKFVELQIVDSTGRLQPEFSVKVWQ